MLSACQSSRPSGGTGGASEQGGAGAGGSTATGGGGQSGGGPGGGQSGGASGALGTGGSAASRGGTGGGNTTPVATGGTAAGGTNTGASGALGTGGAATTGGNTTATSGGTGSTSPAGGATGTGGSPTTGGSPGAGGGVGAGGAPGAGGGAASAEYVVAMVQSSKAQATDITQDEVRALVREAVTQAGGLDFIKTGQTVVLKPNLLVSTSDGFRTQLPAEVNGITADWRIAKAVAELVRERVGSTGKILVMEGSTESTTQAFSRLGYTAANLGTDVDELIPLEGTSCSDRSTTGLMQKAAKSGTQYWINKRYHDADVVISLPVMKTHVQAGITGAAKNLGIGTTPASQYSTSGCSRDQNRLIPHSVEPLSQFIADYYSLRPADFVVMDGLQGIQHGPLPAWGGGNYNQDKMNMRLILASRNAIALDTVEALVMSCNPAKVPHLTKLEAMGLGTTDPTKIKVVGKQVSDVKRAFAGPSFACPGS